MIDRVLFDVNPIRRALWSTHHRTMAREFTAADLRKVLTSAGVTTKSQGKGKKSIAKLKKPELLAFAQRCADLLDIYNAREIKKIPGSMPKYYIGFAKWLNGSLRGIPDLQGFRDRSPALWTIEEDIINALAADGLKS